MNNNSRPAFIIQLVSKKFNEENAIKENYVLMQHLDTSYSKKCENKQYDTKDPNIMDTQYSTSRSIVAKEPFCTDENPTSGKENFYFEDSDDSYKDPNFEIDGGYKSSSSGSIVGQPTKRKLVEWNSQRLSEEKNETEPYVNIGATDNLAVTPSTSKNIPQRKRSIFSDSSSSISSLNSSNSSRSNSKSSISSSISSSNATSKSKSSKSHCSSNDVVSLPCNQESNVFNNNILEQVTSPVRKSSKKVNLVWTNDCQIKQKY
ncbi:hypothetical protein HHI36_001562 [Cryptolaemus montrouzieri]|uniref:Uncharacterized protein n=1 Tax=Cryptolaemus montrouzieri TaxID=559131 RepID=A0ABD2P7U7_9CUCU